MHADFWHERWACSQTGFHEPEPNPLLLAHFEALGLTSGARIFVPLCGKSVDIDWLLARGHRVVGAELSRLAVAEVFERLGLQPAVTRSGELESHCAAGLQLFVGDILQLSAAALGQVDGVYDRAALIALPAPMRRAYAAHVQQISGKAPQLLITLEYDQSLRAGPPFAVSAAEVRELFRGRMAEVLARQEIAGGLKGQCPASEVVWKV